MNKKKYIYDKCDIKKNKNLYQYSEFQGVKFLNIFLKSRKKLLKKLTKDQQHFEDKYKVFEILDNEEKLNFINFSQVYEKDIKNTKWSKLFTGNGKERELLEITESENESTPENDS